MTTPEGGQPVPDVEPDDSPASAPHARRQLRWWQESLLLLVVALVLAVVVKTFFAQAFYIPSESMEPGLVVQDRILVQKVSYWGGGEPQRGDIVVFEDPGGWLPAELDEAGSPLLKVMTKIGLYPSGGHLVKRVVGVAGDVIDCCDDQGRITVNGHPLDEDDYIAPGPVCNGPMVTQCSKDWKAGPVPEGHIFVMGDNRGSSSDSSFHMCKPAAKTSCVSGREFVSTELVVGRVGVRVWPLRRFTVIHRPGTFADVPDVPDAPDAPDAPASTP